MRERLIELIGSKVCGEYSPTCDEWEPHSCEKCYVNDCKIGEFADLLLAEGWMRPPCKVGDTVYKICPKCNPNHKGSCNHCAWRGCYGSGCDVGVGIWSDGSHNEKPLQIVPYKVTGNRFITIIKYWNLMFFSNTEEAEKAISEYDEIRKIEDRKTRYEKYLLWEAQRELHYPFLKGGAE